MRSNWGGSFKLMLASEGGYVNHPEDPGGRTNLGVTQRVWERWIGRPVTEQEMRDLTPEMVTPLYKSEYWDACRCDELPAGVDYVVFDLAVNAGPKRAVRTLQAAVGTTPDGALGPITLAAAQKQNPAETISKFSEVKNSFYKSLPSFPTFGRGWMNRVQHVQQAALEMVESSQIVATSFERR